MGSYAIQILGDAEEGRCASLWLGGEFDLCYLGLLRQACARACAQPPDVHVTVDLTAVDFIDAGCLREVGLLIQARRAVGDVAEVRVASTFHVRLLELLRIAEDGRLVPPAT